jgi:hypothetical protein
MNRIALAALAGGTVSMPTHKFQVGDHVQWNRPYQHMTSDIYEIVRQGRVGPVTPGNAHELDGADHCCFPPSTPTS